MFPETLVVVLEMVWVVIAISVEGTSAFVIALVAESHVVVHVMAVRMPRMDVVMMVVTEEVSLVT